MTGKKDDSFLKQIFLQILGLPIFVPNLLKKHFLNKWEGHKRWYNSVLNVLRTEVHDERLKTGFISL